MSVKQSVIQHFHQQFRTLPKYLVRAPGRVNLIGEHTDYNNGFVLPIAIDREIWIAIQPRNDNQVVLHSLDFTSSNSFSLDQLKFKDSGWIEYIKGVAWSLMDEGYSLSGWEGSVMGDIPIGAGLSSSAALEIAAIHVFSAVQGFNISADKMALIGQKAENEWIGVNCGIMDQLISAGGKADQAILIDCESLKTRSVPIPSETNIVVMDTGTRRGLMDSAYNERRSQCESVARFFGVSSLREVSIEQLKSQKKGLSQLEFKRAHHVVSENQRTLEAVQAMEHNDSKKLGGLMVESHKSLRDDFDVSAESLNEIVKAAIQFPNCYGARMTGAGFGGCAIALIKSGTYEAFGDQIAKKYLSATGQEPILYVCNASKGAECVKPDA